MAKKELQTLTVYGLINNMQYQKARFCVEDLYWKFKSDFNEPQVFGMVEFEWELFIDAKKKELRGETWAFEDKAIVFMNGQFMGGPDVLLKWAVENYEYNDFRPDTLIDTLTEEDYKKCLNSKNHDFVYMDISIGNEAAGRLVFELFTDMVPKTCANFKALCTGEKGKSQDSGYTLHYKNTLFHRIVRNGWVQGGDIFHGRGNGGESIYGGVFEDENFAMQHIRRGILGMANKGRHTNNSQFYITLQPAQWMNTKYVAFGQVIEGTETLKKIEALETMNERPNKEVKVTDCGEIKYVF